MSKQTTPGTDQVSIARLMALKQAVRLEATGLKHSSGRSMRRVAARELGLAANTNHDSVVGALAREIEKRMKIQQEEKQQATQPGAAP